jgi:ELWxxDGT repeat protein
MKSLYLFSLLFFLILSSNSFSQNLISDIRSGQIGSDPHDFESYSGKLYFSANDGTNGIELWSYDPVTNVTSMALDIKSGSGSSLPLYKIVFDNKLFFAADKIANTGGTRKELYYYDDNTNTVTEVPTSAAVGNITEFDPKNLIVVNGALYFDAIQSQGSGAATRKIFKYDGNDLSLISLPSGIANNLYKGPYVKSGNYLFFTVFFSNLDYKLVRYDTTNDTSTVIQNMGNDVSSLIEYNDLVYGTGKVGGIYGLKQYDPNTNSVDQISSIFPKRTPVGHNGVLYFPADNNGDLNGLGVYQLNSGNPVFHVPINSPNGFLLSNIAKYSGNIYFQAKSSNASGVELHMYNTSNGSITQIGDINSGSSVSSPDKFYVFNNKLFFQADDGVNGLELWSYDANSNANVENFISNSFKLFPNPAKNYFRLEKTNLEILNIKVFNILGSVVKKYSSAQNKYDISSLPKGVFLLEITTDKGKGLKKLLIE